MGREIIGNSYKYIIDKSYGINKDGFIAIGTESIVYKGLKTRIKGNLNFSCVLKFKPKKQIIDGRVIDRLQTFKTEEWQIFEDLRECRSVVKIDDVIDDLGDFSLICPHIDSGIIDSASYFCVVEEFIDGWNLDEFCREEFWKLRKTEPLENGLQKKVDFSDFNESEKKRIFDSYTYDNQLKFQNQILLFMINLCEIMEYVTEQKNILHLDIKPENIMVTRYGKELVLIDFGRSKRVTNEDRFAYSNLTDVDYNKDECQEKQYEYGALGYAAPECFCEASESSAFPFSSYHGEKGKMSIESDIFSFGATFWECLNMFEIITKNNHVNLDMHDFYRNNFLNDDAYCNRDLSFTTTAYHQRLERIIKKCTKTRNDNFTTSENYYHSYRDLKKDIEITKDSVPTILKEEDVKVRTSFKLCGVTVAFVLVMAIINSLYHGQSYKIAQNKWENLTASYNETQFSKLTEIANDYVDSSPSNAVDDTYSKIAEFTYQNNGSISDYEASMLVDILLKINDKDKLPERVDEIMLNADTSKFKEISTDVVRLDVVENSIGYELAAAIYDVEVSKTNILDAYNILQKYKDNTEFKNAVVKLKYVLDTDEYIEMIMDSTSQNREEVMDFFNSISK